MAEIVERVKSLRSESPTHNIIWDFSKATFSHFSYDQLVAIMEQNDNFVKYRYGGKVANIQPHDLGFGLARMYESHLSINGSPIQTRVFRTAEEAYNWLDVIAAEMPID